MTHDWTVPVSSHRRRTVVSVVRKSNAPGGEHVFAGLGVSRAGLLVGRVGPVLKLAVGGARWLTLRHCRGFRLTGIRLWEQNMTFNPVSALRVCGSPEPATRAGESS